MKTQVNSTLYRSLALVLLAAAGTWLYAQQSAGTAVSHAQVTTVSPVRVVAAAPTAALSQSSLASTLNGAGTVTARTQVMLSFGQAGTVQQLYTKVGDKVTKGQVLAELDATEPQLALANAQAAVNLAQAKYEQTQAGPPDADMAAARAAVDSAQAGYDAAVRKSGVNDAQVVVARAALDTASVALQKAQSDYDTAIANGVLDVNQLAALSAALKQAKIAYSSAQASVNIQLANINDAAVRGAASALASAKANLLRLQTTPTQQDLQIAQAQLEQARIALQQAQYRLRSAQLIAPFDGTVTQVDVDNFSGVSAGTPVVQLADLSALQVTLNVSEMDIGRVKAGQDVAVTISALVDAPAIRGKVDHIGLNGTTTQGVVNYPVVVDLMDPGPAPIMTGMTANVAIVQ